VCQSSFREVLKEGVLIDVCTQCRGVWLDRGELEKLLTLARSADMPEDYDTVVRSERAPAPPPRSQPRPSYDDRDQDRRPRYDDDDDDHKRHGHKVEYDKYGRPKKKKGLDFLDIFDFGD
jgi:hypothetical protein